MGQVKSYLHRSGSERDEASLAGVRGAEGAWRGLGRGRRLVFREASIGAGQPRNPQLRVGIIMDDFSAAAFSAEWTVVALRPDSWEVQLRDEALDFVVVESAWAGNAGLWRGKITGPAGPSSAFRELIAGCRAAELPAVFWNKEDPPHYEDFLPAARLFDHVFTTDANMLPRYRSDLGHSRVSVLPFAAQPRIHNPARPRHGWHAREVAFAGMYFAHKYEDRRRQMDYLLGAAVDATAGKRPGFEIFSRQLGGEPQYQFPGLLKKHVVGSLSYKQMLTAYKAYKVFLNVNSVTDSPSMCARRIFEITAAGTCVVSTPSVAITEFFPEGEIPTAETREAATHLLKALTANPDYAQRLVHKAQRRIWAEHTYSHRAQAIAAAAQPALSSPAARPQVSVLVSSFRPQQLDHVLAGVAAQQGVDVQLVYLAHGFELDDAVFRRKCLEVGIADVVVLQEPQQTTLGECLNSLVERADGRFATKWDDDDVYSPLYLGDQVHALMYSEAEVVGKRAHYMHLAGAGATILRNPQLEHRYVEAVSGPTIFTATDTFRRFPFEPLQRGEDSRFLSDVIEAGGRIYSADRFNYCQMRSADVSSHTWPITNEELLASSKIQFFGSPEDHISV
ncbi:glycosyltransferase [Arthrobacter sp. C9C5]|uniref:glycosyltransferase n=1 Tax=Arthrobacter sp. C9C5 TaxID=2735267 RepID=UPI001585BDFD|nr:glycosyltransferase [Arthrobacter sp. C9C5]NUU33220.1 glycosyltransferase [Arthrobacter sp. C9C5]